MSKIKVVENGRSRTMTAQEVILRNLVNQAAHKDLKATVTLFALNHRYANSPETVIDPADLPQDDQDVMKAFFDQAKASLRSEGHSGSTENDAELGSDASGFGAAGQAEDEGDTDE